MMTAITRLVASMWKVKACQFIGRLAARRPISR